MSQEHRYSTFALDLHWADERSRDPAIDAHLAECDRCRTYVGHLSALDDKPLALPAAARQPTPWWRRRFVVAFAFAAAVVVALVVWRRSAPSAERPQSTYVAAKSAAAVQVLVRRDGRTRVWDGSEAIRPRDALALRVACEAMTHVTVLVRDRDSWKETFAGACLDEVLPFTLVVDDQPGGERIAVVMSSTVLAADVLRQAVELQTRRADIWALQLAFKKEAQP